MVVDIVDKGAIAVGVVVLAYRNADEVVDDSALVVGLVVVAVRNVVGGVCMPQTWSYEISHNQP
jgi:hypothetical protein